MKPQARHYDATSIDLFEVDARARALRSAAVTELLTRFRAWLRAQFDVERARRRRAEAHLARAQYRADLEHRLRKLERQGPLMHI